MKVKMLFWMLLGLVGFTHAQVFEEGMIITRSGDTLLGFVAKQDANTMAFKRDRNGERNLYPMDNISGYTFQGDQYEQHVVEVLRGDFPEKTEAYLRVVVDGPLRLLEYRGKGLFGSEHMNYYLHYGDEVPYRINRNPANFKQTMKWYFEDCEELSERIRKKELGYDNLVEIVNTYNTWYILQAIEAAKEEPAKTE